MLHLATIALNKKPVRVSEESRVIIERLSRQWRLPFTRTLDLLIQMGEPQMDKAHPLGIPPPRRRSKRHG